MQQEHIIPETPLTAKQLAVAAYQKHGANEHGLAAVFDVVNRSYFDGSLPRIPILFKKLSRGCFGKFVYVFYPKTRSFEPRSICISELISMDASHVAGTVAHEMIHYYQANILGVKPDHSYTFTSRAMYIEQDGFDGVRGVDEDGVAAEQCVAHVSFDGGRRGFLMCLPADGRDMSEVAERFSFAVARQFAGDVVAVSFYLSSHVLAATFPLATKKLDFRRGCRFAKGTTHRSSTIQKFLSSSLTKKLG